MRRAKKYLTMLCVCMLCFCMTLSVRAAGVKKVTVARDAKGAVTESAIQKALNLARSGKDSYEITVPAGTVTLSKGLQVYSRTTLKLTGVTLTRKKNVPFITVGKSSGKSYKSAADIEIRNGIFEGKGGIASWKAFIAVYHAQNVTISGGQFKNGPKSGFVTAGTTQKLYIKNCLMQTSKGYGVVLKKSKSSRVSGTKMYGIVKTAVSADKNSKVKQSGNTVRRSMKVKYYAHRGYNGSYPENTMVAFEAAMNAGYDGIEFDVFETNSGDLLVFHDSTTDRVCGKSASIYNISKKNRKNYPVVKAKNASKYKKSSLIMPTFEETVKAMAKRGAGLYVNLKGTGKWTSKGVKKMVSELEKYKMLDKSVIFCSNVSLLKKFKNAGARVGLLSTHESSAAVKRRMNVCIKEKFDTFVVFLPQYVDKEIVTKCHKYGVNVGAYKVPKLSQAKRLENLNVDFIFSDYTLFK